jgi:hypothetical protein
MVLQQCKFIVADPYEAVDANTLRKIMKVPLLLICYSVLLLGLSRVRRLLPDNKMFSLLHLRMIKKGFWFLENSVFFVKINRDCFGQPSNIIDVIYVVKGFVSRTHRDRPSQCNTKNTKGVICHESTLMP